MEPKVVSASPKYSLLHGDCLEQLKLLPDNCIDSVVTDPPAGISFMGKAWDDDKGGRDQWIAWLTEVMRECNRVLKPGAHALVWAIPRTSHWTATAIEDAGFEIRDVVTHLFGSGFPKSLDISKAIDKEAGAKRQVVGQGRQYADEGGAKEKRWEGGTTNNNVSITAPATNAAKQWQGFGTALKPAAEFWVLARKPLSEKTVAKNVLKHGTGGLNIDASRIGSEQIESGRAGRQTQDTGRYGVINGQDTKQFATGRFPANLVLSGDAPEVLDEQSGPCKTGDIKKGTLQGFGGGANTFGEGVVPREYKSDIATGASRFFYCAKVSASERNAGLEGFEKKQKYKRDGSGNSHEVFAHGGDEAWQKKNPCHPQENNHPTVKPQKLMQYLIKLITPPGGIVLDCFMGSGSTGVAAQKIGFDFVGIEREKEYFDISAARIKAALDE